MSSFVPNSSATEEIAFDSRTLETALPRAGRLAALEEREKRVDASLRMGKTVEATRAALENPPFGSKNVALKDRNSAIVMRAVVALGQKDVDVAALLESLDADLADNLTKVRLICQVNSCAVAFLAPFYAASSAHVAE